MLLLAKWIHANISSEEEGTKILVLFDTLAERYQNNESMLGILNTALKLLYDLGRVSDDTGLLYLISMEPKPCIGPAESEINILAEQLEYWIKENELKSAMQVLKSWLDIHSEMLMAHPEIKNKMLKFIKHKFDTPNIYNEHIQKVLTMIELQEKSQT